MASLSPERLSEIYQVLRNSTTLTRPTGGCVFRKMIKRACDGTALTACPILGIKFYGALPRDRSGDLTSPPASTKFKRSSRRTFTGIRIEIDLPSRRGPVIGPWCIVVLNREDIKFAERQAATGCP